MSFRLKLLLGLLFIGALALGVISLVNIFFFRGIYLDYLRSQGSVLTDLLRARVEKEIGQNPTNLENALTALSGDLAHFIKNKKDLYDLMIVDPRGKILSHPNLQLIGQIQDPPPASLPFSDEQEGEILPWEDRYLHFIPFFVPGERAPRFYLRLSYPKKKILLTLATVQIRAFAFSLLGFVLLLIGAGLFYHRLLGRRMEELLRWLYRLSQRDYGEVSPPSPREAEFRELWEVLKGMEKELAEFTKRFLEESGKVQRGGKTALSLLEEGSRKGNQFGDELKGLEDLLRRLGGHLETLKEGIERTFAELDSHKEDLIEIWGGYLLEFDESTTKLGQGVKDLETRMGELTEGMQEVQRTTEESVAGTDELASEVNELAQAILQIRKSSELNKSSLEETVRDSQRGMELMSGVEERISLVSSSITEVSSRVQNLIRQSERIGEILKVIQQITEKTNLLALNTAIIATQAGKHGGQFAVVAEEIRDLSQRVKSNAEEVHRLVEGIQGEIQALGKSFEESLQRVREGTERSHLARDLLSSIASRGEKILLETQQIFRTLEDQSEAAQALSSSMAKFQGSLHIARDHLNREQARLEGAEGAIKEFYEVALKERNILTGIREKIQRLQQFFQETHKRFSHLVDESEHSKRGIEGGIEKIRGVLNEHGEILEILRKAQNTLVEIEISMSRLDQGQGKDL